MDSMVPAEKQLRKGVDFIGISVVGFCHNGLGEFLMIKRSINARDEQGRWDLPAGGVEYGDTAESTLRKEIKEEVCADVLSFEFMGFRDVHRVHNGKPTHWIALDFKVLIDPAQVAIGEPHKFDGLDWFKFGVLPEKELLHSQLPYFLEKYKDKL